MGDQGPYLMNENFENGPLPPNPLNFLAGYIISIVYSTLSMTVARSLPFSTLCSLQQYQRRVFLVAMKRHPLYPLSDILPPMLVIGTQNNIIC
jgi:hypothetical protein